MLSDLFDGALAYLQNLSQIRKYGLGKYLLLSGGIGLAVALLIGFGIYLYSDNLGKILATLWKWEWGSGWITKITSGLSFVVMAGLFYFLFRYIMFVILGPILSLMSMRIEKHQFGVAESDTASWLKDMMRGMAVALRNIVWELVLTLAVIILGFVLPIFSWAIPILILCIQGYYAGFGNMDYTMERYYSVRSSAQFVKSHRFFALGNGLVFIFILLIPILGIFLAPFLGTLAATSPTLKRIQLH